MKLYFEPKLFPYRKKQQFYNENEAPIYYSMRHSSFKADYTFSSSSGSEALNMTKNVWSFKDRYRLTQNKKDLGEIIVKPGFGKIRVYHTGRNWYCDFNSMTKLVEITQNGRLIARINRKVSFKNRCDVEIMDSDDVLHVIALITAILFYYRKMISVFAMAAIYK